VELSVPRGWLAGTAAVLSMLAFGCDPNSDDAGADLGLQATIGLEFAVERGCPTCHGADNAAAAKSAMAGSSTPLAGTSAYASNLTPDTATGIGGWADIEIVRAMRFGVDNEQQPLCPPMPHFDGSDPSQPFMSDVEAAAIVAWLRALPPVVHQVPESMCPPIKPRPPVDMAAPPPAPDDMVVAHD
jgi:hypothetical protein